MILFTFKHFNLLTCFRNDGKRGVYRAINAFSLVTELNQKYKDVELQLTFLKTEVQYENNPISTLSSCCPAEGCSNQPKHFGL